MTLDAQCQVCSVRCVSLKWITLSVQDHVYSCVICVMSDVFCQVSDFLCSVSSLKCVILSVQWRVHSCVKCAISDVLHLFSALMCATSGAPCQVRYSQVCDIKLQCHVHSCVKCVISGALCQVCNVRHAMLYTVFAEGTPDWSRQGEEGRILPVHHGEYQSDRHYNQKGPLTGADKVKKGGSYQCTMVSTSQIDIITRPALNTRQGEEGRILPVHHGEYQSERHHNPASVKQQTR